MNGLALDFAPLLPWPVLWPVFAAAALLAATALIARSRGAWLRLLALAALAVALANPSVIREEREPVEDIAVIAVDDSPSQEVGERTARTEQARRQLQARLGRMAGLETRIVQAGDVVQPGEPVESTRLFTAIDRALADVPRRRMAGTILLSDGQIHDVPPPDGTEPGGAEPGGAAGDYGPIHLMLSGRRGEKDRRLSIVEAPEFGLVGNEVTVRLRVEDLVGEARTADAGARVGLTLRQDGGEPRHLSLPRGRDHGIELEIGHGGQNVYEFEVAPLAGEMTRANNRVAVVINGVRDRLRVLLVSGEPHPGERTWRALLRSDPSVDLIHFTILRPPEKQDATPIDELSLIAFPVHELFEVKLDEFDLIIFDRYRMRGVLPGVYLQNIADYVRKGGAVLEAAGPAFVTGLSLYQSAMGEVLPAAPVSGEVTVAPFRPELSDLGRRHPVTAVLPQAGGPPPERWGRWFRQMGTTADRGRVLMRGHGGKPLLVLDSVDEGRVAQLTSDHIWLWSRRIEGGGPQAELLRRVAHWLMKEPALDADSLRARVEGNRIHIERRKIDGTPGAIEVIPPSAEAGEGEIVEMSRTSPGLWTGVWQARETGIYRITDGTRRAVAAVGTVNPPELADLRTTAEKLRPLIQGPRGAQGGAGGGGGGGGGAGGSVTWLVDGDLPDIRRTRPGRDAAGRGWIGLRDNGEYRVVSVADMPLVPIALVLALALGGSVLAWMREAR